MNPPTQQFRTSNNLNYQQQYNNLNSSNFQQQQALQPLQQRNVQQQQQQQNKEFARWQTCEEDNLEINPDEYSTSPPQRGTTNRTTTMLN